jgi:hypothetical protein
MKEKKARVEDALNATRAAVEEGIVPGGGVALVRCSPPWIPSSPPMTTKPRAYRLSAAPSKSPSVRSAATQVLKAPWSSTRSGGKDDFGYNAATGEYEDLLKAGVIDPKKVTRIALQNAASVASLLLTTECAIAEKPECTNRFLSPFARRAGLSRPFFHSPLCSTAGTTTRMWSGGPFCTHANLSLSGAIWSGLTWRPLKQSTLNHAIFSSERNPHGRFEEILPVGYACSCGEVYTDVRSPFFPCKRVIHYLKFI